MIKQIWGSSKRDSWKVLERVASLACFCTYVAFCDSVLSTYTKAEIWSRCPITCTCTCVLILLYRGRFVWRWTFHEKWIFPHETLQSQWWFRGWISGPLCRWPAQWWRRGRGRRYGGRRGEGRAKHSGGGQEEKGQARERGVPQEIQSKLEWAACYIFLKAKDL